MRLYFLFGLFALGVIPAMGQKRYSCNFVSKAPTIDGAGNEEAWQRAPWMDDFTDIEGDLRPAPALRTRTKMLWDSVNLYIYAEMEEPDLWATLRQHDTIVYDDNDFEVFIDPDGDMENYFELEFNAFNTEMDLFMPKPYRFGGKALLSWDVKGLRSAVKMAGTMNKPGDRDKGWSIEMAIPLSSLKMWGDASVHAGTVWRINFSRVEWDREVKDGGYVVLVDPATGHRKPEHNWVWSPQGVINMHVPEKWGYLEFLAQ